MAMPRRPSMSETSALTGETLSTNGAPRRRSSAYRGAVAIERLKSPRARLFVAARPARPGARGARALAARARSPRDGACARPAGETPARDPLLSRLRRRAADRRRRRDRAAGSSAARWSCASSSSPSASRRPRPRLYAVERARATAPTSWPPSSSAALEAARLYKPEKRPFWPHVTVARVRPSAPPGPERGAVAGRPRRVTARSRCRGPRTSPSVPSGWLSTVRSSARRGPSTCPSRARLAVPRRRGAQKE